LLDCARPRRNLRCRLIGGCGLCKGPQREPCSDSGSRSKKTAARGQRPLRKFGLEPRTSCIDAEDKPRPSQRRRAIPKRARLRLAAKYSGARRARRPSVAACRAFLLLSFRRAETMPPISASRTIDRVGRGNLLLHFARRRNPHRTVNGTNSVVFPSATPRGRRHGLQEVLSPPACR